VNVHFEESMKNWVERIDRVIKNSAMQDQVLRSRRPLQASRSGNEACFQ